MRIVFPTTKSSLRIIIAIIVNMDMHLIRKPTFFICYPDSHSTDFYCSSNQKYSNNSINEFKIYINLFNFIIIKNEIINFNQLILLGLILIFLYWI